MEIRPTKLCVFALLTALAVQPAFAEDARPSETSVRQLFKEMHTSQALRDATEQVDATMRTSLKQAEPGRPLNAEQQKIRDEGEARLMSLVTEALDWSSIEPLMVESYRETFTQQEVSAMLRFYESPIGRSVGAKLPAVSQQMVRLTQQRMRDIVPKIAEVRRDTEARIKAAADTGAEPAQPSAPSAPPH
jgi:uncharacterized protein